MNAITRTTPSGPQVRERFYDAASNPIREEVRLNGTLIARSYTDYDELNRVRARRGNDGQETVYAYDLNAQVPHFTAQKRPFCTCRVGENQAVARI